VLHRNRQTAFLSSLAATDLARHHTAARHQPLVRALLGEHGRSPRVLDRAMLAS
jgi:hypothetical protein